MPKKTVDAVKKSLQPSPKVTVTNADFLSTGSTLLNLACSGTTKGGFPKGKYVFLVGDSSSGKSFLSLTCMAEASINPAFKDYRFIFDDVEGGAMMDFERFFGKRMADRIEPPAGTKESPKYSSTVEEFYYHFDDAVAKGKPFIFVLDSMDSLNSDADDAKFQEAKTAHEKGKEITGTYGTSKAKANSVGMRKIVNGLRDTGSILIVISQTRDNIGFGSQFAPKSRGGGHALRFYASLELWSEVRSTLKKSVKGKDRQIGILAKLVLKKNRLTGKLRTVEVPIYHSSGMDDLGSIVDYLVEEQHWPTAEGKKVGIIKAPEFEFEGKREALVALIEVGDREAELIALVGRVWKEIEAASDVNRKGKYD